MSPCACVFMKRMAHCFPFQQIKLEGSARFPIDNAVVA
jgi:hypothetical protein